jgi:Fe2+ or Zn2+ uptake regulation protein
MSRLDMVFDRPRIRLTASEICYLMKSDGMGSSRKSISRKLSQLAEAGVLRVDRKTSGWLYTWNSLPEAATAEI